MVYSKNYDRELEQQIQESFAKSLFETASKIEAKKQEELDKQKLVK